MDAAGGFRVITAAEMWLPLEHRHVTLCDYRRCLPPSSKALMRAAVAWHVAKQANAWR